MFYNNKPDKSCLAKINVCESHNNRYSGGKKSVFDISRKRYNIVLALLPLYYCITIVYRFDQCLNPRGEFLRRLNNIIKLNIISNELITFRRKRFYFEFEIKSWKKLKISRICNYNHWFRFIFSRVWFDWYNA